MAIKFNCDVLIIMSDTTVVIRRKWLRLPTDPLWHVECGGTQRHDPLRRNIRKMMRFYPKQFYLGVI